MASTQDVGDSIRRYQNDMPSSLQAVLFCVLAVASVALATLIGQLIPVLGVLIGAAGIVISFFVAGAIKVANQWQRGVVLRLGEFRGIRGPGLFFIIPVVDRVRMIDMPEELKKIMSRQAGAEREKRATITKAEGDKLAAENLAAAATIMGGSPGAMQLRTRQTIDGLGPGASNTVILAVPIEIMEFFKKLNQSS
jgi:hypothetical protein